MLGREAASQIAAASLGVVLAAGTLASIRLDELRRDDPGIKAERGKLACPVVRTGAGLHGDHAAGRQAHAPLDELGTRNRLVREHAA